MHYSNKEFSKNGADTIQSISDPTMPLGNINSLSAVDVLQINLLYNCPEALKQGTLIGTQCRADRLSVIYVQWSLANNATNLIIIMDKVKFHYWSKFSVVFIDISQLHFQTTFLISFGINETSISTASSPVVPASFNVTSPVKLVGRTRLGRLAINGKSKMAEPGEESNVQPKKYGSYISFLSFTMILKCLEGMYVTYTSEIFSDPRRKRKVFVEQYLGLFLAELGLFCHFVPGLLAIALSSRLPLFIWIAGIGLRTRLQSVYTL